MKHGRLFLIIAIAVSAVLTFLVFTLREGTAQTVTGHLVYSLSYSFIHFAIAGIIFSVMKAIKRISIRALYVKSGGALLIVSILIFAGFLNSLRSSSAQGASEIKQSIHDDAMLLMGAGLSVSSIAAYCNKHVESDSRLIAAASEWNERHRAILERVVRAIEWSGGMAKSEKEMLDRLSYQMVRTTIEAEPDRSAYCRTATALIRSGTLDLHYREDTAPAVRRIENANMR